MADLLPGPEMVIDAVDQNNGVVGSVRRKDLFSVTAGFRTVHVFLFDTAGRLMLQQVARQRDRNPLAWGSSVAGYVFAGETYEAAAARRTEQELGMKPHLEPAGICKMRDQGHDKFVGLFLGRADGGFLFDRSHVESVSFLSMEEIVSALASGETAFTPTFRELFAFYSKGREKSASG